LKINEKQGEWGKTICRDGYTPYSAPIRYPISTKETHCCKRLVRAYNPNDGRGRGHETKAAATTNQVGDKLKATTEALYKTGFNPSTAGPEHSSRGDLTTAEVAATDRKSILPTRMASFNSIEEAS